MRTGTSSAAFGCRSLSGGNTTTPHKHGSLLRPSTRRQLLKQLKASCCSLNMCRRASFAIFVYDLLNSRKIELKHGSFHLHVQNWCPDVCPAGINPPTSVSAWLYAERSAKDTGRQCCLSDYVIKEIPCRYFTFKKKIVFNVFGMKLGH